MSGARAVKKLATNKAAQKAAKEAVKKITELYKHDPVKLVEELEKLAQKAKTGVLEIVEAPKVEVPKVEAPKVEAPKNENPDPDFDFFSFSKEQVKAKVGQAFPKVTNIGKLVLGYVGSYVFVEGAKELGKLTVETLKENNKLDKERTDKFSEHLSAVSKYTERYSRHIGKAKKKAEEVQRLEEIIGQEKRQPGKEQEVIKYEAEKEKLDAKAADYRKKAHEDMAALHNVMREAQDLTALMMQEIEDVKADKPCSGTQAGLLRGVYVKATLAAREEQLEGFLKRQDEMMKNNLRKYPGVLSMENFGRDDVAMAVFKQYTSRKEKRKEAEAAQAKVEKEALQLQELNKLSKEIAYPYLGFLRLFTPESNHQVERARSELRELVQQLEAQTDSSPEFLEQLEVYKAYVRSYSTSFSGHQVSYSSSEWQAISDSMDRDKPYDDSIAYGDEHIAGPEQAEAEAEREAEETQEAYYNHSALSQM